MVHLKLDPPLSGGDACVTPTDSGFAAGYSFIRLLHCARSALRYRSEKNPTGTNVFFSKNPVIAVSGGGEGLYVVVNVLYSFWNE